MAHYNFIVRPRKPNSNEPISYNVTDGNGKSAGTLTKLKNNWHLNWLGTQSKFASRHELAKHFRVMGHQTSGL